MQYEAEWVPTKRELRSHMYGRMTEDPESSYSHNEEVLFRFDKPAPSIYSAVTPGQSSRAGLESAKPAANAGLARAATIQTVKIGAKRPGLLIDHSEDRNEASSVIRESA